MSSNRGLVVLTLFDATGKEVAYSSADYIIRSELYLFWSWVAMFLGESSGSVTDMLELCISLSLLPLFYLRSSLETSTEETRSDVSVCYKRR